MGQPDVVEHAGVPYPPASRECSGLCAQRWWYENRLGLDTEAWSVELDASDRVLTTSRDVTATTRMRIASASLA